MKQTVAVLRDKKSYVALAAKEASNEDIIALVGSDKFAAYDDGSRFLAYCQNGVGLITKLLEDHIIVTYAGEIAEILPRHLFRSKYQNPSEAE